MLTFDSSGLYTYQIPAAEHLARVLQERNAAIDGSDMGTGKTAVACAVIRHFNLPTLVLAPQISLPSWERMGVAFKTEFDVLNPEAVRTGNTPFGRWSNPRPPGPMPTLLRCTECQCEVDPANPRRCPYRRHGIHCVKNERIPHNYGKFIWHPAIKFLVFDEAHGYGALDSLQSDMLIAARRQNITTLAMSATAADSPLGLRALGYVLGLHSLVDGQAGGGTQLGTGVRPPITGHHVDDGGGFYRFAFRMGCKKHPFGGLYFGGDEEDRRGKMAELHQLIFPSRGYRVRIQELGDSFPSRQITADLYDLGKKGSGGRIDSLYAEMDSAVGELRGLSSADLNEDHALTKLLRARQELELVMLPLYEELARQCLESGVHVAIFVNFSQSLRELAKRLNTKCLIYGGQNPKERQHWLDRYQADEEPIILLNSAAGGISINLHDVLGLHARCGIVSLCYSAVVMRQIFGRLWRVGGKSTAFYRVPLLAGTVQEKIHKALAPKLDRIDLLNDGDLFAANLPLTRGDLRELFNREAQ